MAIAAFPDSKQTRRGAEDALVLARRLGEEKLAENIAAFVDAVVKAKPAGAKGTYLQRVALSSTMGPGVKVDPASIAVAQH